METTAKFKKGQHVEYKNGNYNSQGEIIDIRFHERHQQIQYLITGDYLQEWHYEEQITAILPQIQKVQYISVHKIPGYDENKCYSMSELLDLIAKHK